MSEIQTFPRPMSQQMRAVLSLLSSDQNLWQLLASSLDLANESINWQEIFDQPLSHGHRAAVNWAHAVWTDNQASNVNYFDSALSMDAKLQAGCLRALAIRWGIKGT